MRKLEARKNYVKVRFEVDEKTYSIKEDDVIAMTFPDGTMEFLDFKLKKRYVNGENVCHVWDDVLVLFNYYELELTAWLSELMLDKGCEVEIR